MTRARNQVVFVSSICYSDIDPNKTQNLGPGLPRNYLEFAELGTSALSTTDVANDGEYQSPFEEHVGEALKRASFTIHRKVGTSKFRIDLAIVDPRDPGRYLLGVECDGRAYHQTKTARDRDRLCQEQLGGLGWTIHRIWSTEWIRYPERELVRAVNRITELLNDESTPTQNLDRDEYPTNQRGQTFTADQQEHEGSADLLEEYAPDSTAFETDLVGIPYRVADFAVPLTDVWETPLAQVTGAVVQCVEIEGPIHQELLQRRLTVLWVHQRAGARKAQHVERATLLGIQRGRVRRNGAFLWPMDGGEFVPRGASVEGELRQVAHIADEEIADVLRTILERAKSIGPEEVVVQVARVFGSQRVGSDIRARILEVARNLYRSGKLQFRDGCVQINPA